MDEPAPRIGSAAMLPPIGGRAQALLVLLLSIVIARWSWSLLSDRLVGYLDTNGDGDVTPADVLQRVVGESIGHVMWAFSSAYRAVSAAALLFIAGGLWLASRALMSAMASRMMVTYVLDEAELCISLARAVELGQLERSRHLRLGMLCPQGGSAPKPRRSLSLRALQPWRVEGSGGAGGAAADPSMALDTFELELDRRFASRLCVWEELPADGSEDGAPPKSHIMAGSAGGFARELLRIAWGGAPSKRRYFYVSASSSPMDGAFDDGRGGGYLSVTLLRSQRDALWPVLALARSEWHGAREGLTTVKRLAQVMIPLPPPHIHAIMSLPSTHQVLLPPHPTPRCCRRRPSSLWARRSRGATSARSRCPRRARRAPSCAQSSTTTATSWRACAGTRSAASRSGAATCCTARPAAARRTSPRCSLRSCTVVCPLPLLLTVVCPLPLQVLAGHTGSDLYVVDLSSATQLGITDDNVSDVVRSLPPRSILLLKNIDACVAQRGGKRKDRTRRGKDDEDRDGEDGKDDEDGKDGDDKDDKEEGDKKVSFGAAPASAAPAAGGLFGAAPAPAPAAGGLFGAASAPETETSASTPAASASASFGSDTTVVAPSVSSETARLTEAAEAEEAVAAAEAEADADAAADDDDDEKEGEEDEDDEDDEDEAEDKLGYSAMLNALDGALANNQVLLPASPP